MVEVKENPEFFYIKEIPLYCLLKNIYIYISDKKERNIITVPGK